jgi:excisionase family DNA binding protein
MAAAAYFDIDPVSIGSDEAPGVASLRAALEISSTLRLVSQSGTTVELPGTVQQLLLQIVRELGDGNAVSILPVHAELTTQEAADLLNVSRPYLIGLVDDHRLPCSRTAGQHRRLRLADVLAFKHRRDIERRAALDEMSAEAERLGLQY